MNARRWAIVGAGAQGRIVRETLRALEPATEAVFIDDEADGACAWLPVHRRCWLLRQPDLAAWRALIAVGRNDTRLRLADDLTRAGVVFGILVHPTATVFDSAAIGAGGFVAAGAVVGAGAVVEAQALVNTRAVVEHDCHVGEGASLAPGVVMAGRVRIGKGAFVGVGAVLNPRVRIGAGAIVGAGSVVTRDVPDGMIAYGSPARVVRPVDPARDWLRLL